MSATLNHLMGMAGTPVYLGTIIATTTINNHDTATPFNNTGDALKGKRLVIQTDAACHVAFGTTNAVTASASATGNGYYMAANQSLSLRMDPIDEYGWIACVAVSGTANLKVWELKGAK